MGNVKLMQGSEACCEGAIRAGARFFAGYPITPATEICEKMSEIQPKIGGRFIQMEDEIASVGAICGASLAGYKAFTATSGPGFSLMCDIRIAGESAKMAESYLNVGIVPGDGGAYFLPKIIGKDKALDMFLTRKTVKGNEAADMGLVTYAVPDAELDTFTDEYMKKIAEGPQMAMRFTKRTVQQGDTISLRGSLDMISSFMQMTFRSTGSCLSITGWNDISNRPSVSVNVQGDI